MKTTDALLSPAMARARAEGRKTMTRRVVKLPSGLTHSEVSLTRMQEGFPDGVRPVFGDDQEPNLISVRCPYVQPGDRIRWLTTWAVPKNRDNEKPSSLIHEEAFWSWHDSDWKPDGFGKLRPGRFLPGFLRGRMPVDEITVVRVERLQEITGEDARAEGVNVGGTKWDQPDIKNEEGYQRSLRGAFQDLWKSIHGSGSWDANPWVWVIEFRRCE